MRPANYILSSFAVLFALVMVSGATETWSEVELTTIKNLSLSSLPPLPRSPTNAVADNLRAAELGKKLFFDKTLSEDGSVACSTCHNPDLRFTDGNALSEGIGTASRNAPSVIGAAYHRFQFWDGRADSLWAQALGPLESGVEHGTNRMFVAKTVFEKYRKEYEAIFGSLPNLGDGSRFPNERASLENPRVRAAWNAMQPADQQATLRVFVNVGKTMEAYERRLLPGVTVFDRFAAAVTGKGDPEALRAMPEAAQSGLKLFIGKAGCITCHSGALLTDESFHNTGIPVNQDLGLPDSGRLLGVIRLLDSGFNCLSVYSDFQGNCNSLLELQANDRTIRTPPTDENTASAIIDQNNNTDDRTDASNNSGNSVESPLLGAFKTPSLRNVALTAPYMHAGQFTNLRQVLEHYRRAPKAPAGTNEVQPVALEAREVDQLIAFLNTLSAPPVTP